MFEGGLAVWELVVSPLKNRTWRVRACQHHEIFVNQMVEECKSIISPELEDVVPE